MGKVVSSSRDVTAVNRHEIDAPAGVLYSYNGLEQRGRVQRFDDSACRRRGNQHMCHVSSWFRSRVPPSPGIHKSISSTEISHWPGFSSSHDVASLARRIKR